MKLITFSLWGEDPKYGVGAIRNAELARIFYPDWICKFYVGYSNYNNDYAVVDTLEEMDNTIVVHMDEPGDWRAMFWRFCNENGLEEVEAFISRDCDSRLGEREAAAVQEWMSSTKLVHSMGDHPYHFNPSQALMGGMFGMKKHACPEMTELVERFVMKYPDAWQCDQDFLKDVIWPIVQHKVLAHSDIHARCQPFPVARENKEFVGAIIGPNEERLHPEHHEVL